MIGRLVIFNNYYENIVVIFIKLFPYLESVFTPKDISEEDLDAEERELEAFKRFCQQSVPPKHKEKVAHLNVKDIVLKKKNDVTYS